MTRHKSEQQGDHQSGADIGQIHRPGHVIGHGAELITKVDGTELAEQQALAIRIDCERESAGARAA